MKHKQWMAGRTKVLAAGLAVLIGGAVICSLFPPLVLERIVDGIAVGQAPTLGLAFWYFGTLAAAGILEAAQNAAITVFGQNVTHGLRSRMCGKLSRLPAAYFTSHEPGKITSRFVGDVDAVETLFTNGVISMAADICKVVGILAVIFWKSRGLGVLLMVAVPALFVLTRVFQKRMLKAQLANREAVGRVNNHIPETIRNIRMIHTLSRETYMEQRYDDAIEESYRAMEKSNIYDSIYSPIVIFISSSVISVMMLLSARGGAMQTFFGMSVGTAVAVIDYVGKVFTPLESIGMEIQNIQSAVAGKRRIEEFLKEEERQMPVPEEEEKPEEGICFSHVDFGYDKEHPVLENLSFSVKPGEYVTLAGRTGAGKSTVLRLLLGLYPAEQGEITIGGVPAGEIPDREKRKLFGYVEQSFRLVPGTVEEQITLFDPSVSRNMAEEAARLAGLEEAILSLEQGYDTPVTETTFSQGQLELLSVARAVAADPKILLLDEMTANLDADTEHRVLLALEQASKNRTVLSVSHRLYEQTMGGRLISI